ncbi:MAG: TRAP transporter substrate-binding protein DctP [Oscillospiraceae bacterium]|nr:TRAP transporter substrate-binding protein DctP [Oscillospiraceae bacterium]
MKKLIALLLAAAMLLALCACGASTDAAEDTGEDTAEAQVEPDADVPAADAGDEEEAAESSAAGSFDDEPYYEWSMSTSQIDNNWYALLMDEFAAEVESRTDGHITITVYHNNTLGSPEDIYNGMVNGTIDVVNLGMSQAGSFPVNDITQVPFLCEDPYEALAVLNALYDAGYMTEYTDNGFQLLSFHPTDIQMICLTDTQVESISDFSGLNIRVNSGSIVKAVEAFGATAVSITTTEVYMSLSTGVVDGAVSSPSAMLSFAFNDACDYLYEVPLAIGCNYLCVSDLSWNQLSDELKAVVQEVADEIQEKYMVENIDAMNEAIAAFKVAYEPTDEALAEMSEATAFIRDEWAADLTAQGYDGEAIMELTEQTLEAYRAAN